MQIPVLRVTPGDTVDELAATPDDPANVPTDRRRSRWDAHRAARREEFIGAAILAIGRHGSTVGMDQIAAVARTSKPVVYRYFEDKDDLYRAVSRRIVGEVLTTLAAVRDGTPSPRELIQTSVEAYLVLLEQNPELYRFVSRHQLAVGSSARPGSDFSAAVAGVLADQLGEHLRAGGLDPTFAHPWGEAIVGFISAASLWWLDHPTAMTRQQLAQYLSALLWGGAAGVSRYAGVDADPQPKPGVFPRLTQRAPRGQR